MIMNDGSISKTICQVKKSRRTKLLLNVLIYRTVFQPSTVTKLPLVEVQICESTVNGRSNRSILMFVIIYGGTSRVAPEETR